MHPFVEDMSCHSTLCVFWVETSNVFGYTVSALHSSRDCQNFYTDVARQWVSTFLAQIPKRGYSHPAGTILVSHRPCTSPYSSASCYSDGRESS